MEVSWLAAFCLLNVAVPRIRADQNVPKTLSNPELVPGSPNVTVGSTVTIRCLSSNASLPVTFTLFYNISAIGRMTVSEKREATFNVTIYNHTSLGPYKCKANNSTSDGLYSKNFTFILQEYKSHGSRPTGTLSNPELVYESPNVTVGSTVTIRCRCINATLPITFTLFQNKSTKGRMTVSEKREATFNVTIYNHTSLGSYKCKANNTAYNGMYSKNVTFILQEHIIHGSGPTGETGGGWVHLAWIIPLLVLVILTAAFVFWRISTPDAKQEEIQEDATYETVSERETERRREEEEIHYSTVILKEGSREVTCAEQTAEYSIVTRTGQGFNSSHNSQ